MRFPRRSPPFCGGGSAVDPQHAPTVVVLGRAPALSSPSCCLAITMWCHACPLPMIKPPSINQSVPPGSAAGVVTCGCVAVVVAVIDDVAVVAAVVVAVCVVVVVVVVVCRRAVFILFREFFLVDSHSTPGNHIFGHAPNPNSATWQAPPPPHRLPGVQPSRAQSKGVAGRGRADGRAAHRQRDRSGPCPRPRREAGRCRHCGGQRAATLPAHPPAQSPP